MQYTTAPRHVKAWPRDFILERRASYTAYRMPTQDDEHQDHSDQRDLDLALALTDIAADQGMSLSAVATAWVVGRTGRYERDFGRSQPGPGP
jgi:hypothetical protein